MQKTDQQADRLAEEVQRRVVRETLNWAGKVNPLFPAAIQASSVPHWINSELLVYLLDIPLDQAEGIITWLAARPFVEDFRGVGYSLHERVRNFLRDDLAVNSPAQFKELSAWALKFFAGESASLELQAEYSREVMYHMLITDENQGLKTFEDSFEEAERDLEYGIADHLVNLLKEQAVFLSPEHRSWSVYYEARIAIDLQLWEKGDAILRKAQNDPRLEGELKGRITNSLGLVSAGLKRWDEAIRYYEQSIKSFEETQDEPGLARACNNLGWCYQLQGRPDEAEHAISESLIHSRKIGRKRSEALSLNNLGLVHRSTRDYQKAIELTKEASVIYKSIDDKRGISISTLNLCQLYYIVNELDQIRPLMDSIWSFTDKLGMDDIRAKMHLLRAKLALLENVSADKVGVDLAYASLYAKHFGDDLYAEIFQLVSGVLRDLNPKDRVRTSYQILISLDRIDPRKEVIEIWRLILKITPRWLRIYASIYSFIRRQRDHLENALGHST